MSYKIDARDFIYSQFDTKHWMRGTKYSRKIKKLQYTIDMNIKRPLVLNSINIQVKHRESEK